MKKLHLYLLVLLIIAAVALILITTVISAQSGKSLSAYDNQPVPESVLSRLSIPDDVSSSVGVGLSTNIPKNISAPPLTVNGKPAVAYIGAEFCPFCAIERWSLVIALMRFGSFTGLEYMTSSPTDIGPSTPTFTFINSTYTSNYIEFISLEGTGNIQNSSGQYPILQRPTALETAMQQRYDPDGAIPFVDFANKTIQIGANYNDPTILANKNWSTIAGMLRNASSVQAMALVGSANLITAQICKIDGNMPQSVCGQGYIKAIEALLH